MCLNLIGVAYYGGLWFDGNWWRSLYHILQASRVVILWNVLHRLGSTSSGEITPTGACEEVSVSKRKTEHMR